MYILIDLSRLLVLHKHPERNVIVNLAHIECASCHAVVGVADYDKTYDQLTMLDVKLLYKNTTGKELEGYCRESVVNALVNMINRIPVSDVVDSEVSAQAFKVPYGNSQHFVYVKGSDTPSQPAGLFFPVGVNTVSTPEDQSIAKVYVAPKEAPPYVPAPPPAPKVPGQQRSARAAALLPGVQGVGQGAGANTLTARIYAFCDEQVRINEASENKVSLDSIRLGCCKNLISQGVNPSTARRQTMEWMKSVEAKLSN